LTACSTFDNGNSNKPDPSLMRTKQFMETGQPQTQARPTAVGIPATAMPVAPSYSQGEAGAAATR
jgi:hypothetical protein